MTVDYLEPYRQMARSIRFVPPLPKEKPHQSLTEFTPLPGSSASPAVFSSKSIQSVQSISSIHAAAAPLPIDPSGHATALIQAAVTQPTIVSPVYVPQENIGDQISRLADVPPPKPDPVAFLPKIPQPDPNWTPLPASAFVRQRPAVTETVAIEPVPVEAVVTPEEAVITKLVAAEKAVAAKPIKAEPIEPATPATTESPLSIEPSPSVASTTAQAHNPAEWIGAMAAYMEQVTQQLEQTQNPASVAESIAESIAEPISEPVAAEGMHCPHCHSTLVSKNGRRAGKQKYACQACKRQFTATLSETVHTETVHTAKSTPKEPIALAKPNKKAAKSAAKKQNRGFGTSMKGK